MAEPSLTFSGDLDIATTAAAHRRALAAHRAGSLPETLDLGKIARVDSAGLALLLELKAWARDSGRALQFTNPPDSLRVLAELSQADELLGWTTEEA
jgi:phospholipid transport system transporter-binding protein